MRAICDTRSLIRLKSKVSFALHIYACRRRDRRMYGWPRARVKICYRKQLIGSIVQSLELEKKKKKARHDDDVGAGDIVNVAFSGFVGWRRV